MHQYILSAAYFLNRIITREIIFYRRQSSWLSICFHDAVLYLVISFPHRNILYISMLAPWIPRYKIITSILNFFFSKQSSLPPPSPKRKKTSYNLRKDINYFACFYTNNIQSVTSSRILSKRKPINPPTSRLAHDQRVDDKIATLGWTILAERRAIIDKAFTLELSRPVARALLQIQYLLRRRPCN